MSNKLLRTVKRLRTARKVNKQELVTVFEKTTYGYFETGERKGQVNKILIADRVYEIFPGTFYNYQMPLRENQSARLIKLN